MALTVVVIILLKPEETYTGYDAKHMTEFDRKYVDSTILKLRIVMIIYGFQKVIFPVVRVVFTFYFHLCCCSWVNMEFFLDP